MLCATVPAFARDGLRRGEDDLFYRKVIFDDQLEQQRARFGVRVNKRAEVWQIILVSRQVYNTVYAVQGFAEIGAVGYVAFDKLRFGGQVIGLASRVNARL